jgi:hypothetical protein
MAAKIFFVQPGEAIGNIVVSLTCTEYLVVERLDQNFKATYSIFRRQLCRLHSLQIVIDGFQFIVGHAFIRVPWHGRIWHQLTHPEAFFKVLKTPSIYTAAAVRGKIGRDELCSFLPAVVRVSTNHNHDVVILQSFHLY